MYKEAMRPGLKASPTLAAPRSIVDTMTNLSVRLRNWLSLVDEESAYLWSSLRRKHRQLHYGPR